MPTTPITPLPLTTLPRHILLVGGTFDPPHQAHADMALAARDAIDAVPLVAALSDQCVQPVGRLSSKDTGRADPRPVAPDAPASPPTTILFVPAARSPFKPPPLAPDALRVEMLTALCSTIPASAVWTDELDRASASPAAPSYWIDTLQRAHAAILHHQAALTSPGPLTTLHFLIGADQAIALHRWRSPRRLLELARPVIVLRPPMSTSALLHAALTETAFWSLDEIRHLASRVALAPLSDVSATTIRRSLRTAPPTNVPGLPRAVADILTRTNPYAAH